jgi:hypothetical protein
MLDIVNLIAAGIAQMPDRMPVFLSYNRIASYANGDMAREGTGVAFRLSWG